ncbi:hypothetical protein [Dyella silvae]|uniref:hypothetical protein n=1 Tax=Dyella silvae TaxID=2994424 RepID=UPI0022652686|nr:hypothetical protein [Dyella silvae]
MIRHLLRQLRHCHALFALALCAWLALSSMAWAQPDDCCPNTTASPMSMSTHHGGNTTHPHDHAHATSMTADGCCAHAAATVPPSMIGHVLHAQPGNSAWQAHREVAPHPVYEPPLRPPLA